MSEIHDGAPEPQRDTELFIDFVNTLEYTDGVPDDQIADASALHAWLTSRGLLHGRVSRAAVERRLPAFHDLRRLIADVTERVAISGAPSSDHVRRLNLALRDGLHYHQLRRLDDASRYTVTQVGDPLDYARSSIADSLAHYLAEHEVDRLRICANDGCRWRFVDHSPAGRRRWCDMRTCGNRAKVARHRARAREAGSGS